jgi:imidazolonepropionase-like amidohydrolase
MRSQAGSRQLAAGTRRLSAARYVLPTACCLLLAHAYAQKPTPAPPQTKSILLKGGTVHVGDGTVIDDAAVGFRNGAIDYVGHSYGVTAVYDTTIITTDQHIYPGLILPDNSLGLHEVDLVRATSDEDDTGELEPELRALSAYNTDSRITPTVKSNGVLIAQVTPRGGTIAGTSSVVQLDAWDNASAAIKADDGIHMTWPKAYQRTGWWAEPGDTDKSKGDERAKRLQTIDEFFRKAQAYALTSGHPETDLRMEAMRGLFNGMKTLFVEADGAQEIQEAVLFAHGLGIKRTVIVGGYDAWRVADLLLDKKVDVILRRTHSLPMRDDDDVDLPYRLPALLRAKGVRFCLGNSGDMERMGGRNLAFLAGTASAYGLTKEDALQTITLDAARVLGIDQRYGSLTIGKSATLFISTGDALDMRTNNVTHAFIDGRHLDLDDHQKKLYRQYHRRYAKP